jgi:flagellin
VALTVSITAADLRVGSHTVTFSDGTSFSYQLKETINLDGTSEVDPPEDEEIAILEASIGSPAEAKASANQLTIQTGANQGDELKMSINGLTAEGLGLISIAGERYSIGTDTEARDAISIVNTAINLVSNERAKLGALQNRLNHKISNLDTSTENLSAAESRIRDLDMAKEMTNYTRNNILVQASTAMLAQANASPQSVLSLIG